MNTRTRWVTATGTGWNVPVARGPSRAVKTHDEARGEKWAFSAIAFRPVGRNTTGAAARTAAARAAARTAGARARRVAATDVCAHRGGATRGSASAFRRGGTPRTR